MYITAYSALIEPIQGKIPTFESIESLYDQVDSFIIVDASKYDQIDLSQYDKVKHIKTIFNPFDNPFGGVFTTSLRLATEEADVLLFLDLDEIWDFKGPSLKEIIGRYPMDQFSGIAFKIINYYCNTHYIIDGCQSKGPCVFEKKNNLVHDLLQGFWKPLNNIRRITIGPDTCDGVRLCDFEGRAMNHWSLVNTDEVIIHHTSHLDQISKRVRSLVQFNHTSVIDIPELIPYDMRVPPEVIQKIYELGEQEIKNKDLQLYGAPIPIDYEENKLLEDYIKRCEVLLFDPTTMKSYAQYESLQMGEPQEICKPKVDTIDHKEIKSETSVSRSSLLPFCSGNGLDIGSGGDPIKPDCISLDLEKPYTMIGSSPINLYGNGTYLRWFTDNCLDFVYSSHLLEDFPPQYTIAILREWLRVVRPGGNLVLCLPDEPVYRKYCEESGHPYNPGHQNHELNLDWFEKNIVPQLPVTVIYSKPLAGIYSFEIVLKKN